MNCAIFQVRKIEFLLADALEKGCDNIITSGAFQSNHARATAVASRQLGLQPHLILALQREIVSLISICGYIVVMIITMFSV